MHSEMTTAVRLPWRRSRACYSRSRLMLWDAAPSPSHGAERRSLPLASAGVSTQPGRERPHVARPEGVPRLPDGVAHVPAVNVKLSPRWSRGRLVRSTGDPRPISAAPVVTRSASLPDGQRALVSV